MAYLLTSIHLFFAFIWVLVRTVLRTGGRGCGTVQPNHFSVFQAIKWWVGTSLIWIIALPRYSTELHMLYIPCAKHVGCRQLRQINWSNQAMWNRWCPTERSDSNTARNHRRRNTNLKWVDLDFRILNLRFMCVSDPNGRVTQLSRRLFKVII